jgi:hypothetical protein
MLLFYSKLAAVKIDRRRARSYNDLNATSLRGHDEPPYYAD